jgi:hypothetical protein
MATIDSMDTVFVDEAEDLFPDPPTIEEDVVDDWLKLSVDDDSLTFDGIPVADTEQFSKRYIRELEEALRNSMEAMVNEGLNRLRREIAKEEPKKSPVPTTQYWEGTTIPRDLPAPLKYVVVDFSPGWERMLHLAAAGWLSQAVSAMGAGVTLFNTTEEAQLAIESTRAYKGGCFAWSHNDFRILPFEL